MNKRKPPPKIKIYEALGAIADDRLEISGLLQNEGKCYSSSGNKYYIIQCDEVSNSIMTNDNASYRKGYLGYPAIAFLMKKGIIIYDKLYSEVLKGIARKDINQKFANDFDKTVEYIHTLVLSTGISLDKFLKEIDNILSQIEMLNLSLLGSKITPPLGY